MRYEQVERQLASLKPSLGAQMGLTMLGGVQQASVQKGSPGCLHTAQGKLGCRQGKPPSNSALSQPFKLPSSGLQGRVVVLEHRDLPAGEASDSSTRGSGGCPAYRLCSLPQGLCWPLLTCLSDTGPGNAVLLRTNKERTCAFLSNSVSSPATRKVKV